MSETPLGAEFSSAPTSIQSRNGQEQHAPMSLDFLSAGGEMGALMRGFDWSATAIRPPET
jgi:hypothetical protein